MMKIAVIVGNRPQFIKAVVVCRAAQDFFTQNDDLFLIHTGQHYDNFMSNIFFEELDLPKPRYNLGIGSGRITDQIGAMMKPLREVLEAESPDVVLVFGDTNSTLAGALVAAHLGFPLAHVEAGERLYIRDRQPEELNRVATDALATLCLPASRKAVGQLEAEGISSDRIIFTGDTMFDLFLWGKNKVAQLFPETMERYGLAPGKYILATLHRAENTDDPQRLRMLLGILDAADLPVILPIHPRTAKASAAMGWEPRGSLKFVPPCGYFEMMSLLRGAELCFTDSGGLSREAFWSQTRAVVPMSASPWPEISQAGWLERVDPEPTQLTRALVDRQRPANWNPDMFGTGDAGRRIIQALDRFRHPTTVDWRPPLVRGHGLPLTV